VVVVIVAPFMLVLLKVSRIVPLMKDGWIAWAGAMCSDGRKSKRMRTALIVEEKSFINSDLIIFCHLLMSIYSANTSRLVKGRNDPASS
jgi:hypothetical protein